MSFSFYGGPKGQDFSVSRVFSNRSEDLLKDLKMRWYSPVNIGDYVFISYGDINAKDQYYTASNGENVITKQSSYNKNLDIDLSGCGKSYNNSLWQKIYVDEDKNISPNFPDKSTDEIDQVFIFLNLDDSKEVVEYFVKEKTPLTDQNNVVLNLKYSVDKILEINQYNDNGFINKTLSLTDYTVNGNVITLTYNNANSFNHKVIYKTEFQEIGTSLKETTQLYTEDTFGFGYRLIACLTGATPKIEFRSESKNIEDGDPSIKIDTSILEKPIVTFQLPKAQEIKQTKTNVISSINKPSVYMDTIGEGTRTNPVLTFDLPKSAEIFTGILFGKEDGAFGASNAVLENGSISIALNNLEIDKVISAISAVYYNMTTPESNTPFPYPQGYYFSEGLSQYISDLVQENFNINRLPVGYYGINKNTTFGYLGNLKSFLDGLIGSGFATDNQRESAINNLFNNFNQYAGTFGLLSLEKYNLLNGEIEKKLYIESYLDGFYTSGSFHLIGNIIRDYLPIGYSLSWFNAFNKRTNDNQQIYSNGFGYYKSIYELAITNLRTHFSELLDRAYIGDYYINIPTGRMYKFMILPDRSTINVKFVGAIMREAPEVSLEPINAMKQQENGTFTQNIISLESNVDQGIVGNANFKEKYTFKIPKHPEFNIGNVTESQVNGVGEVTLNKNSNGYEFNFSLPTSAKIYNGINSNIKTGDYYFDNGALYQYNGLNNSILITNLIGHANAPSIIGEIKIIIDDNNKENPTYDFNTIIIDSQSLKNTTLKELLLDFTSKQFLSSPYDNNLYIVNIYNSTNLIEPTKSYYGVYSKNYKDFNVISCFGEFDDNSNNISKIYKIEKYEGEWALEENDDNRIIYFLINPYNINSIKCLLKKKDEIKELSFDIIKNGQNEPIGIDYKNNAVIFEKDDSIILTYPIKNYINPISNQKYLIRGQYYIYNGTNKTFIKDDDYNYTIEPTWTLMEFIPSDIIVATSKVTEDLTNKQVYSTSYINNILSEIEQQQSQLKWKSLADFITEEGGAE